MKTVLSRYLIWFTWFAFAASVAAQNGLATISGTIRDLNGKPIAGATVYTYDTERLQGVGDIKTISDLDGKFVLRNLPPGTYGVSSFKESEGYSDTFFSFFASSNKKAWQVVQLSANATTTVDLELGPKNATLQLSIRDDQGNPVGGGLTFRRVDDPRRPYGVGVKAESNLLVPPVPFRFEVEAKGFQIWRSRILRPASGETVKITVRLTPVR